MDENKTFNISMPKALLDAIDKQAQTEFRNRSDLIREAARSYIANKGGLNVANKLTPEEELRIKNTLDFGNFKSEPTIIISCSFRPQPNSVKNIFESNSNVIKLLENPPTLRRMGWDLQTLDRARPIAGEYLELANGKRKLLRLYRDGQFVFSGGLAFFGHAVNQAQGNSPSFNLLSVAECIFNFVKFSEKLPECLKDKPESAIYKISISNPSLHDKNLVDVQAYDGLGTDKVGELTIDWVERDIVVRSNDDLSAKKIAYMIYSEFSYFFGMRGDELWYVDKSIQEMDTSNFTKVG